MSNFKFYLVKFSIFDLILRVQLCITYFNFTLKMNEILDLLQVQLSSITNVDFSFLGSQPRDYGVR